MLENLEFGALLMVVGMSMVFLILAMLWGVIAIFQQIDRRMFAREAARAQQESTPIETLSPELLAAITIAIHRYRQETSASQQPRLQIPKRMEPPQARWVAVGRSYQLRSHVISRKR